jgi:limonene-1,2-epoxide hydrolase
MTPEEIVRAALAAWSGLNADEIASYFAPDAMWEDGPVSIFRGYEQIRRAAERYVDQASWCDHEVLKAATTGTAVLTERADHWVMKDGSRFDTKHMGAFEISDGKITAWRDYCYLNADTLAYARKLVGS